jgi:hypothetical protein
LCTDQCPTAEELADRKETAKEWPDRDENIAARVVGVDGVEQQDNAALHQVPQVEPPAQQLRRESRSALEFVFVGLDGGVDAMIGIEKTRKVLQELAEQRREVLRGDGCGEFREISRAKLGRLGVFRGW